MSTNSYDVVIIGGGFAGTAIAWQLAKRGQRVLLLEANSLGSGTSGASAGRAQVSESHRGAHLDLVLAGLARLETLQEELDCNFEWRRLGNLMLIEQDHHWAWWSEQVDYLTQRGVPAKMLNCTELQKMEPLLNVNRFQGAAWCLEGHLNPLKYCHAFAQAARQHGAIIRQNTPVIRLDRAGSRVTTVHTADEKFSAGVVLVTAGAWTAEVLRQVDIRLPVQFTHAEAIITEALAPSLSNHVGLADFYETIHNAKQAVSIGVAQQQNGTLLITEAVEMSPKIHRNNSCWGTPGMAKDFLGLFPSLSNVRIIRAWAAPSPFLPDEHPAIGWVPDIKNLFVATCFHLTITTIPIISQLVADAILGQNEGSMLEEFSPARFGIYEL